MIIAQISDTHLALDSPDADKRRDDFERAVSDINALDPQPDVVVHTGDVVHNGRPDEYAVATGILAKLRAPVYVIPGNKDERTNFRTAFSAAGYFSPESEFIDYVIEDYPVRLIALDTLVSTSNKGDLCRKRIKSLAEWIGADAKKPVAVFCHHPPFHVPVGPAAVNFLRPEIMEELGAVLQGSGRVAGVFSGHVHRETKGRIGDVPAIVATAIATTLRYGDYPADVKTRPIYYIHRFSPDGSFATERRIASARQIGS